MDCLFTEYSEENHPYLTRPPYPFEPITTISIVSNNQYKNELRRISPDAIVENTIQHFRSVATLIFQLFDIFPILSRFPISSNIFQQYISILLEAGLEQQAMRFVLKYIELTSFGMLLKIVSLFFFSL
jgi:hypothetical protein